MVWSCLWAENDHFLVNGHNRKTYFYLTGRKMSVTWKYYLNLYTNLLCCSYDTRWWIHRPKYEVRELFLSTKWSPIITICKEVCFSSMWCAKQRKLTSRNIKRDPQHKINVFSLYEPFESKKWSFSCKL